MMNKTKRILLVDDEKDLGWLISKMMGSAGHSVICATTVKDGMKKFKKSKNLDIAIIDLWLGKENGLTFIKKAKTVNKKVRFIMTSGLGTRDVKNSARRLGVSHFLDKPIKPERLLNIINQKA